MKPFKSLLLSWIVLAGLMVSLVSGAPVYQSDGSLTSLRTGGLDESTVVNLPNCGVDTKNELRRVTDNIRGIWTCDGTAWRSLTGYADVRDFTNLNDAVAQLGTTVTTLVVPNTQTLSATVTVPATMTLKLIGAGMIVKASIYTIRIAGPFEAPIQQVFSGFAAGDVTFGVAATTNPVVLPVAYAEWWGAKAQGSAATNAIAFQSAINSESPAVLLLPGLYQFDTGLTIDRAILFGGSSSSGADSNATGQPGRSTTRLDYTAASGVAITLVGSGTEGKENIHLHDFSLWGTANADGGILVGSGTFVLKSSIKNVHVKGFTKINAYGFKFGKCLRSYFENIYAQSNYDGLIFQGTNTTLNFVNLQTYANTRYGANIINLATGTFLGTNDFESNGNAGIYLYGSGVQKVDFFGVYSEANNTGGGLAPVVITGSATDGSPTYINFFGGSWADAVAGKTFDLGYADRVSWYHPTLTAYNSGFMSVTANTTTSDFYTWADSIRSNFVTGNTGNKVRIHAGWAHTRIAAWMGTALVAGDIALSAGWGSTATVSAISGTDQRLRFTVTSSGTGQGANPTATLTFKDGTWTTAPYAACSRNGGNQPAVLPTWTTTATTLVITFPFTPTATETYTVECVAMG